MSSAVNVDQYQALNKLKHDLENWRELILLFNSVLKWDKTFYSGVIFASVSLFYLILWWMDLSTLTLISLFALMLILFDIVYPLVAKFFVKNNMWSGKHEKKFEEVCEEICVVKQKLRSFYDFIFVAKEHRSTMFVLGIGMLFVVLAWIGAVVDNLLLCYLCTLFVGLYPGLQQHGLIGTSKNIIASMYTSKIQQFKCNGSSLKKPKKICRK